MTTQSFTPDRDYVCGEWLIDSAGVPTHVYPVVGWGHRYSYGDTPIVDRSTLVRMIVDFSAIENTDRWELVGDTLRVTATEPDDYVGEFRPGRDGNYTLNMGYTFWRMREEHWLAMAARNYTKGC